MAQEEQKDKQVNEEVVTVDNQKSDVDVIDELTAFNAESSEEEPQIEEGSKDEPVEVEKAESKGVPEEDKPEPEPETKSDVSWLIDGKFRDDDEGRSQLAKSYKEMQSQNDKTRNEIETLSANSVESEKIVSFLRENPEAVEAIQKTVDKKNKEVNPPEVPEDFDSMDIYAEGTPTNEWYKEQKQFERKQIISEVVNAVRGELHARDSQVQENHEQAEYIDYLRKEENMSDGQIEQYLEFMTNDENVTTKNMVGVWRALTGQHLENESNLPKVGKERKEVPSAAAISGTTPPSPTTNLEEEDLFKSLMQFNKNT